MNITNSESSLLKILNNEYKFTQRELSKKLSMSLGKINQLIHKLKNENYIDDSNNLTKKGLEYCDLNKPNKAIILAAGYGFRMIPINNQTNKALIEVHEEVLIERLIKQLKEKNINNITIVVGYKKEQFDYLIDQYNVKLKYNKNYATTNSLYSLSLLENEIENTYIIPCDLYFNNNPFSENEVNSWYMMSSHVSSKSQFALVNNNKIVSVKDEGNYQVGLGYINYDDAKWFRDNITTVLNQNMNAYWEEALVIKNKFQVLGQRIDEDDFMEFNTYNDLLTFDSMSKHLQLKIIEIICEVLNVNKEEISKIRALKTGMTNRSFMFNCKNKKYIMRIPGEGTDLLINRKEEANVYKVIDKYNLCDKVIYINENNGYKLTEFIENAHNCDAFNIEEVKKCMKFLKQFHNMKLKVDHVFNIFDKINYYESLWNNQKSVYKDYIQTKEKIFNLKKFIDSLNIEYSLTHIDSVADNFMIFKEGNKEQIKLIDWEYSSNQDPHVDIAMFAIYSLYNKDQVDQLINLYFEEEIDTITRAKIYAYIAACGLLWSNWCEYKAFLGVEFGEYALAQYRYAKDYYKYVKELIGDQYDL